MVMKLCVIFFAVLITACSGTAESAGEMELTAQGTGQGYRGTIRVLVTSSTDGIMDIEILEHEDDPLIGGAAMETLLSAVLDNNSLDLDAVSGATESSEGFLAAVRNALSERE